MELEVITKCSYEPFYKKGDKGIIESEKDLSLSPPKRKIKRSKYTYNPKDKSNFYLKINGIRISETQLKLQFGTMHPSDLFEAV